MKQNIKKGRAAPRKEKTEQVLKLAHEMDKSTVIAILNLHKMPASALQKIKGTLTGQAHIRVVKKCVLRLALEKAGRADLVKLLGSQPAVMLSSGNPFKLYRTVSMNKSPASAKAGDIAPEDITVPAGPTDIPPGPAISTLTKVKIAAKVEGGKIAVSKDSRVAKAGDVITADLAGALSMLKIRPMSIGLDIVSMWEAGTLYDKNVLAIDDVKTMANLMKAITGAFNLSVNAGWPTKLTMGTMLAKGFREAKTLGMEAEILDKGIIEELMARAKAQAEALTAASGGA
ncbi:MAG: 50S ribosomal protein L10 [Candidatus Aenigmatarchaeota archaeon]